MFGLMTRKAHEAEVRRLWTLISDATDQKGYVVIERCATCRAVDPAGRDFWTGPKDAVPPPPQHKCGNCEFYCPKSPSRGECGLKPPEPMKWYDSHHQVGYIKSVRPEVVGTDTCQYHQLRRSS